MRSLPLVSSRRQPLFLFCAFLDARLHPPSQLYLKHSCKPTREWCILSQEDGKIHRRRASLYPFPIKHLSSHPTTLFVHRTPRNHSLIQILRVKSTQKDKTRLLPNPTPLENSFRATHFPSHMPQPFHLYLNCLSNYSSNPQVFPLGRNLMPQKWKYLPCHHIMFHAFCMDCYWFFTIT